MYFVVARVFRDDGATVAFASCWIEDASPAEAQRRASDLIESQDWQVAEVLELRPISRDNYADDDDGLQYFEQAEIDSEVCVFFTVRVG
jgi:hypothetical protein